MAAIRLQNVTKQFGPRIVLDDVSLELHPGQIAALVGANGAGKTTIFRLIARQFPPDMGTVTIARGLEVGYLTQEPDLDETLTLRGAVTAAFGELGALERRVHELSDRIAAEHDAPHAAELLAEYDRVHARFEAAGGYTFEQRLNEVLGGLGFLLSDYDLPLSALSGGQKCRAALGRLLLQDATFLLLDEPTNHLDIDAIRWLEKFLAGHHGGAVIISHDRYLLDRVAERTVEVIAAPAGGQLRSYTGNYTQFLETRALERLTQERQYEKDKAFLDKERGYIRKYMAGQRSRQAQGRLKKLETRLGKGEFTLDKPGETHRTRFQFARVDTSAQKGKELVGAVGLAKRYGDKQLFAGLDLSVRTGQRLGITGPNGTGKSTLLKILLRLVSPDSGEVHVSTTVQVGYFAQDVRDLHLDRTIVEELCAVRSDFLERDARHYAARFLFTDEAPFKRIGDLSGGEQSRVRFMKLILRQPDVLILDEPTNHLDIPSREVLEEALDEFPGTVIAVSHDRYFLDRVVERLLVIRPEGCRYVNGNYSDYIALVESERAAVEAAAQAAAEEERRRQKRVNPVRSAGAGSKPPPSRYRRMPLAELETFIADQERRITALHERFNDPQVYSDAAKVAELQGELDTLRAELAEAEAAWVEKADEAGSA
ncbi:MAG: ABC-F family ATP-binding cassette domain-containing protein [Phycisphaerales bacterium]|nr:ABC-F family ATP-binding cassette domain-containing protein [Phycisphaerales bacterium]